MPQKQQHQPNKPSSLLPAISPLSVVRTLWKRKLWIAAVWLVVSIATYYVVKRIPSIYLAQALVLVDSQKIPDRLVSSTVVTDPQDRVATITLKILTNTKLQEIIEKFDLYRQQRQTRPIEDIMPMMRKDIVVAPEKSFSGRTFSFRVSYQGTDPVIVTDVANLLAELYVEENHKARTTQAEGTSEFIETQLAEAKQTLEKLEGAVRQYEQRHNGELPRQEASLNAALSRLTMQLDSNREAISRANQTKASLQDQLVQAENLERARAAQQSAAPLTATGQPVVRPPRRSEELQAQLNEARLRYSDDHPDVKRLMGLLAKARSDEAASASSAAAPAAADPAPVRAARPVVESPELVEARSRVAGIKSNLNQIATELAGRETEQRRILSELAAYQNRVAALPLREQEMNELTRDYENARNNYQSLLSKKTNAAMATDLEIDQKAEQFTVVESARTPKLPVKPQRRIYQAGGSLFGLALGLLLGFALELRQSTLLGEWELPPGVAILGRLPKICIQPQTIPLDGGMRGRKLGRIVLSSAEVALLGAVTAGLYFLSQR